MSAQGSGSAEGARRRRRRVRNGAVAGSAILHLLFVLAVLWPATNSSFAGGPGSAGGGGDVVTVTLVGPIGRDGRLESADQSARKVLASRLDALLQKTAPPQPDGRLPVTPAPQGNLDQLMKQISDAHQGSDQGDQAGQRGAAKSSGDGGQAASSSRAQGAAKAQAIEGKADERGDKGHASGDMWGEIQTCWKPEARVPVTLEVVIDNAGRLALPPRILRPEGAQLDEVRLKAESRAIEAVARCAPFKSGAPLFGRKTYRFAFNAAKQVH